MAFYVGQKVQRIDAKNRGRSISHEDQTRYGAQTTVVGGIYTVREVRIDNGDTEILLLEECDNRHMAGIGFGPKEPGFASYGFRPITERKTSIEIFKAMLNPSKTEVAA